jgi:hypothetical protein
MAAMIWFMVDLLTRIAEGRIGAGFRKGSVSGRGRELPLS